MRPSGRAHDELREISITRHYTKHAEGSVLVEFGDTKIICNASIIPGIPRFLKGTGKGWLTAEYGMLPRATHSRTDREAARGNQSGRTQEIQRLIGRTLRTAVDLTAIGENTITIDCDVIQADGGTRTAAITGGCVALVDALRKFSLKDKQVRNPFKNFIASVSVGVYQGNPVLDLDYKEDSAADTDMNVVANENGDFIEIQGTAEDKPFRREDLDGMLALAIHGTRQLIEKQKTALEV